MQYDQLDDTKNDMPKWTRQMEAIFNVLTKILCFSPFVYLITFYSFAIRAMVKLGRYPTYDNPDPGLLGFGFHMKMVDMTFEGAVYGSGVCIFLMILMKLTGRSLNNVYTYLFIIGIFLIVAHFFDPLFEWSVD